MLWVAGPGALRTGYPYLVVGGTVVVRTPGPLVGLASADGERLWERDGPWVAVVASRAGGLFAIEGSEIVALDPADGSTRWRSPHGLGGALGSALLAAGEDLVCALRNVKPADHSRLECHAAATGEAAWSRLVTAARSLVVARDAIVLGLDPRTEPGWTAFDPGTGEAIWANPELEAGVPTLSPRGDVLVSCSTGCVAVRPGDGAVAWRAEIGEGLGTPTASGSSVFVVGAALYVLDAGTGAIRRRLLPPASDPPGFSGFNGTPAVSGDVVAVFSVFDDLTAFRTP